MINAIQSTAPQATEAEPHKSGAAIDPPPPYFVMPEHMRGWVCRPMQSGSISPSGHVWNTLVCEGFKAECYAPQCFYETEAKAWAKFNKQFAHQAKGYTLCYFRDAPKAFQVEDSGKWYVKARVAFA